jgi:hypothetical protein
LGGLTAAGDVGDGGICAGRGVLAGGGGAAGDADAVRVVTVDGPGDGVFAPGAALDGGVAGLVVAAELEMPSTGRSQYVAHPYQPSAAIATTASNGTIPERPPRWRAVA